MNSKFLMIAFLSATSIVYGSGGYLLQDVNFFNLMAFFVFLMLVVLIFLSLFINTNKAILKTFILWIFLFGAGKIETWYLSYIPSVSYGIEKSYSYGVYEEDCQVGCLMDENITALIKDELLLYVKTGTGIQVLSAYNTDATNNFYEEDKEFWCKEKLKIQNLNLYNIVMTFSPQTKIFVLNDKNEILSTYDYRYDIEKHDSIFSVLKHETFKQYLKKKYIQKIRDGKQSKLFTKNNDCNSTSYTGIIMDKKEKSFYLCMEKKRYQTTYLKYTPKIAMYIPDSDTVLIAYEEKKGLYILRNKYTKIYNKIQDSITQFLKKINQPKWNKADLTKINFDQKKLKKLVTIFTPYEKNQRHNVDYHVVKYDGYQATVKANIDDKDAALFYLKLKNGTWNIEKIE